MKDAHELSVVGEKGEDQVAHGEALLLDTLPCIALRVVPLVASDSHLKEGRFKAQTLSEPPRRKKREEREGDLEMRELDGAITGVKGARIASAELALELPKLLVVEIWRRSKGGR